MSQDWFADVLEFHQAFGCAVAATPKVPPLAIRNFRTALECEEQRELAKALYHNDLPGIADAIADLIYVLIGRAVTYGIDLRPVWDEVHRTNMAKQGGGVREDGKKLKPEGWTPPDIVGVLARQEPIQ